MPKIVESPAEEMQRLIRIIGGKQRGKKDPELRALAARRMGISVRRARTYWCAEPAIISSEDMDRARLLAAMQPIDEAINAAAAAQHTIESLAIDGCFGLAERIIEDLLGRLHTGLSAGDGGPHSRRRGDAAVRLGRPAEMPSVRDVVQVRRDASAPATGARVSSSRPRATAH